MVNIREGSSEQGKSKENALSYISMYVEATDPMPGMGYPRNPNAPKEEVEAIDRSREVAVEILRQLDPSGYIEQGHDETETAPMITMSQKDQIRDMLTEAGRTKDDAERKLKTQAIIDLIKGAK